MFSATKDDAISNLKSAPQNFVENNEDKVRDLRQAAGKAGTKVREIIHNASDEITHAKDTVTTQIRTNPVQSSAIALGVGFILGSLFRR